MSQAGGIVLCIGSTNPTKVKGVRKAFEEFFVVSDVRAYAVKTSVPPQPIGLDQIIQGATERARGILDENCDFKVGLEAGFYTVNGEPYDVEVVYILRRDGSHSIGFSPAFPIPRWIYEGVLSGIYRELEDAVEEVFGRKEIGRQEGFIGLLTRGRYERWLLGYSATIMALVKFLNEELYKKA